MPVTPPARSLAHSFPTAITHLVRETAVIGMAVALIVGGAIPAPARSGLTTPALGGDSASPDAARACGPGDLAPPGEPFAPWPGAPCPGEPDPHPGAELGGPAGASTTQAGEGDWSIVPSPNASRTETSNGFLDVACVRSWDCWAVGSYLTDTGYRTLTARWDGTSWALVPSPNVSGARFSVLYGVTCTSTASCWAAGFSATTLSAATYRTFVMRWDGRSWSIVPSPNGSAESGNVLNGITCSSPSDCWAVGYQQPEVGSFIENLILRWDGASWTLAAAPNADLERHNSLQSVACFSVSECWAVGSSGAGSSGTSVTMRWDGGSWTIVPSPKVPDSKTQGLKDVSCASASDCWAVGVSIPDNEANQNPNPPNWLTLIMHWDGSAWTIVESPNGAPALRNELAGVVCVSASECWAAGSHQEEGGVGLPPVRALALRWDGASWAIVPTAEGPQSHFTGVTCTSASDCRAVGGRLSNTWQTLAERWDGDAWTVTASPSIGLPRNNVLSDVTCLAPEHCWAVGHFDAEGANGPLILRWDGRWWRSAASPDVGESQSAVLSDLACVSSSDCWAVGSQEAAGIARQLILRWDGTSWRVMDPPTILATRSELTGVACASASDCWAVGHSEEADARRTLIEHWDGNRWEIVAAPDGEDSRLSGVACASASDCWAVGTDGAEGALILGWDGTSWSTVATPETTQPTALTGVACASASDCWAVGTQDSGTVTQTLTVTNAGRPADTSVRLTYNGPASAIRGTRAVLSAHLATGTGDPLPGRRLRFAFGGFEADATTDEDGVARVETTVDRSYGSHDLVVSFAGDPDAGLAPMERAAPFSIRWEHHFVDGSRNLRVNTITRELQFAAPGDVSGVKSDPEMSTETMPTGDTLIGIDFADEDLAVDGRFVPERETFGAAVRTASGTYGMSGLP